MTAVYFAVGVLALLALAAVLAYNSLVKSRDSVDEAWRAVDVQLKRRHELVPNLVESVRGSAGHERETLQNVAEARLAAVEAGEPAAVERAEAQLTNALGGLDALAERHPQLRAAESFTRLRSELAGIEDEIEAARTIYDSSMRRYNSRTRRFPTLILAAMPSCAPRTPSRP